MSAALRMEAPVAPEGPSSILDRLARCEIGRAEAQELFTIYDASRPKRPRQKTIVCECGVEFNDDGERTLCGECEYEQEADRWNDMRGDD